MNLFLNPSLSEFQKLFKQTDTNPPVHTLVIDADGEVLIDPELQQPGIDVNRFPYKFRLRTPQSYLAQSGRWLKQAYDKLIEDWETKISKSLVI